MKFFLFLFLFLIMISSLNAQENNNRGFKPIEIKGSGGNSSILYKESHALIIGNSDYEYWQRLSGVKNDVQNVKVALAQNGFDVTVKENLTKSETIEAIDEFIGAYGMKEDNRILIYYAGHGHTEKNHGTSTGYIVPIDAPKPNKSLGKFIAKAIPMTQFKQWAESSIYCKHSLFIFDACFSGSIFTGRGNQTSEIINYKTTEAVRQFISSGSANETVPDESVFRIQFVHALKTGDGDLNGDGYMTGTELGEYLSNTVVDYRKGLQHPQYGKLNNPSFDKGDFVFVINTEQKTDDILLWEKTLLENTASAYKNYINIFPNGENILEAEEKYEFLSWEITLSSQDTLNAFLAYVENFPDGAHFREANNVLDKIYWEKALAKKNIEGYNEYINILPEGLHVSEAYRLIDEIHWKTASDINTISSYLEYKNNNLNGYYKKEATQQIDILCWEKATTDLTIDSYKYYLKICPNGNNVRTAKTEIEKLIWKQKSSINTVDAYEDYLYLYPSGIFKNNAKNAIYNLKDIPFYEKQDRIGTVKAYREYLSVYPNGKRVEQCRNKISQLDDQLYKQVSNNNSIGNYEYYLKIYPNGRHVIEVNSQMQDSYKTAIKSNFQNLNFDKTIDLCDNYSYNFSNGKYSSFVNAKKKRCKMANAMNEGNVSAYNYSFYSLDVPIRFSIQNLRYRNIGFYSAFSSTTNIKMAAQSLFHFFDFDFTYFYPTTNFFNKNYSNSIFGFNFLTFYPFWAYLGTGIGTSVEYGIMNSSWVAARNTRKYFIPIDCGVLLYLGSISINVGITVDTQVILEKKTTYQFIDNRFSFNPNIGISYIFKK